MSTSPQAQPPVIVHLVHGTFPRGVVRLVLWNLAAPLRWWRRRRGRVEEASIFPGPHEDPDRRYWFEESSRFERAVSELLAQDATKVRFERFQWSGNNSFSARAEAATHLRDHLGRARREWPESHHVVLAHSHGGTATVMAIDRARTGGAKLADGVMTLATPFVWLAPRFGSTVPEGRGVVAAVLPRTLLVLAPLLALAALLHAGGGASSLWSGIALGLGLAALWLRQAVVSLALILAVLVAGGPLIRSDLVALSIVSVVAGMILGGWDRSPLAVVKTRELSQRDPFDLPCPLTAVRVPNDEASLVIGIAQLVERLFQLAASVAGKTFELLMRPFEAISDGSLPAPAPWWRRAAGFAALILSLLGLGFVLLRAYDVHRSVGRPERHWLEELLLAAWLPGIVLPLLVVLLLLAWVVPAAVTALAAGREAFLWPGLIGVDAEALPYAQPATQMHLVIDAAAAWDLPGGALVHSIHELPSVRRRVAEWIRAHTERTERRNERAAAPAMDHGEASSIRS